MWQHQRQHPLPTGQYRSTLKIDGVQWRRPFLEVSKQDIRQIVIEKKVPFHEDSTNLDTRYDRNYIRHVLIPEAKKSSDMSRENILEAAIENQRCQADIDELVYQIIQTSYWDKNCWVWSMRSLEEKEDRTRLGVIIGVLHHFYAQYPIRRGCINYVIPPDIRSSHAQQLDLARCDSQPTLNQQFPRHMSAWVSGSECRLWFPFTRPEPRIIRDFEVPVTISLGDYQISVRRRLASDLDSFKSTPSKAYVNGDLIDELVIRPRQSGDWLIPLGMTGRKSVSDYLTDRKVPYPNRDQLPLFLHNESMVWVAGYQVDERYKVTSNTRNVIELSIDD